MSGGIGIPLIAATHWRKIMGPLRFGMDVRVSDTGRIGVIMAELPYGNTGERWFEVHIYRNNERRKLPESMLLPVRK